MPSARIEGQFVVVTSPGLGGEVGQRYLISGRPADFDTPPDWLARLLAPPPLSASGASEVEPAMEAMRERVGTAALG